MGSSPYAMSNTKNNPSNLFNIRNARSLLENTTEKYVLEMKSDGDNWPFCPQNNHSQNFYLSIIDTT